MTCICPCTVLWCHWGHLAVPSSITPICIILRTATRVTICAVWPSKNCPWLCDHTTKVPVTQCKWLWQISAMTVWLLCSLQENVVATSTSTVYRDTIPSRGLSTVVIGGTTPWGRTTLVMRVTFILINVLTRGLQPVLTPDSPRCSEGGETSEAYIFLKTELSWAVLH